MLVSITASDILAEYSGVGVPARARLMTEGFRDSTGIIVAKSSRTRPDEAQQFSCVQDGPNLRLLDGDAYSTADSLDTVDAHYKRLVIYDVNDNELYSIKKTIRIPASTPTTWDNIFTYSESPLTPTAPDWVDIMEEYVNGKFDAFSSIVVHSLFFDYGNDLASAVAMIENDRVMLVIDRPTETVTADLNIPPNITLSFRDTGFITVDGVSLEIESMVDPGNIRIFDTSAEGSAVTFVRGAVEAVRLIWWSGLYSGTPISVTSALEQIMATAASGGAEVILPSGIFTTAGTHMLPTGIKVRAMGNALDRTGYGTILRLAANGSTGDGVFGITDNTHNVVLEGFTIDCVNKSLNGLTMRGNTISSSDIQCNRMGFINCNNGARHAADTPGWQVAQITFNQCFFSNNSNSYSSNSPNSQLLFNNCFFQLGTGQYGLIFSAGGPVQLNSCEIAGTGGSTNNIFIRTLSAGHSDITLINCQDEGIAKLIYSTVSDYLSKFTLIGCTAQSLIQLSASTTLNVIGGTMYTESVQCDSASGISYLTFSNVSRRLNKLDGTSTPTGVITKITDGSMVLEDFNRQTVVKQSGVFGRTVLPPVIASSSTARAIHEFLTTTNDHNRGIYIGYNPDPVAGSPDGYHLYRDKDSGYFRIEGDDPDPFFKGVHFADQLIVDKDILSTSPTRGIGYHHLARTTVIQLTDRSTTVICNSVCGTITMNNASLAAGASVRFHVYSDQVHSPDVIVVSKKTPINNTSVEVVGVADLGFDLLVTNHDTVTADVSATQINWAVIRTSEV